MYNLIFRSNSAGIYGNDIASVAKHLVKIDQSQINATKLFSNLRQLS